MSKQQLDEERIFHTARKITNSEAQAEYVDQICAGDQALRERVEALLEVHEKEQSFLKSNNGIEPTVDHSPITESPGQQIGRYKLLQKIGEGGFGVVYMAEQTRPVRRKVALKIIKPGMDTHMVVARFEAERQALAMMDHANIARVLDGGATDSGRPYFVMELVKGVPITEYCDKNQLPTDERLKLFMAVCQAVQHAHQKGIIHRDLKPSNVLVTLADGEPIVKVIDFGVAKATNQQLTEKTLFTAYGQMIGTPQYMSPEQAEMSCLDVDTRSDVYSLGVLLYELLTGTTPLEGERLRTAGYAEMQRLIQEEEPPKPSTRLSTSGEKLPAIAKHRAISPDKLKQQVQGDLDWIVMKALDKNRNRRYESPSKLADDVSSYLTNEPIEARSPTLIYRARKYVQRNRLAIAVTTLLVTSLSIGLVGTASQWLEARRQANIAQDEVFDRLVLDTLLDPSSSERGLRRAVDLKLKPSKIALLRALASFYEADFAESQAQLEQAEDGIVKQSILAWIAASHGDEPEFLSAAQKLKELQPTNDAEVLIKAQLYCLAGPEQSLEILDEGTFRLGIIENVIRSTAVAHSPFRRLDAAATNHALEELHAAHLLRPNSPIITSFALSATLVAHSDAKANGEIKEAEQYLRKANDIASSDVFSWARVRLHVANDKLDRALLILENDFASGIAGAAPTRYAPLALMKGNAKPAIGNLEKFPRDNCFVKIGLAQLYAATDNSTQAHKIIDDIQGRYKSCDARIYMLYALALAPHANKDDLAEKARELLEGAEDAVIPYRAHLEYWANGGRKAHEEELRRKSPAKAHFEIALFAYVEGDREKAKRHFNEQLKAGFGDAQDLWAKYFLAPRSPSG